MSDKKKHVGFYIREDIHEMLREMAEADLRTLSTQLEIIIRERYAQRDNRLVDTKATYDAGACDGN